MQIALFMQALRILNLFQERLVLRHVMKVPPHLRSNVNFEQAYSRLVKALVPVRGQTVGGGSSTSIPRCSDTAEQSISDDVEQVCLFGVV